MPHHFLKGLKAGGLKGAVDMLVPGCWEGEAAEGGVSAILGLGMGVTGEEAN